MGRLFLVCLIYSLYRGTESAAGYARISWDSEKDRLVAEMVEAVRECRQVPAMSVAIVANGAAQMEAGFGKADVEKDINATEKTPFCIGSCTKALTSTLIGILLEENKDNYPNGWDTMVRDIMPDYFPVPGDISATLTDLLAHRMGLAAYGTSWLIGLEQQHPRQEYCRRLYLMERQEEFRAKFVYNNFMYLLSTCVAEVLGGDTFEELVRAKILIPLGMNESFFIGDTNLTDLPAAYYIDEKEDVMKKLSPELITTVIPAQGSGGLCGPATDMSKWLQFQLSQGNSSSGGSGPLLPAESWQDMHSPQMARPLPDLLVAKPAFPQHENSGTYGLAWDVGSYSGYRRSQHFGSISGFESALTIFPDMNLGIHTSVNGPHYRGGTACRVLQYYIADLALDNEPWLNTSTACSFPEPWYTEPETAPGSNVQRTSLPGPRRPKREPIKLLLPPDFDKFEGRYGHWLFGNVTIAYNESTQSLRFRAGHLGTGRLNGTVLPEIFLLELDGPLEFFHRAGPSLDVYPPVFFGMFNGETGKYESVMTPAYDPTVPPTFQRDLKWNDAPDTGEMLAVSRILLIVCLALTFHVTY